MNDSHSPRRVVVMLGAGGALGSAISRQLAGEPRTDLVLSDIDETSLQATIDGLPDCAAEIDSALADVGDLAEVETVVARAIDRFGRLDVLIGNAGVLGPLSPLGHVQPKDWDNLFAVNVTANWQLIRCMDSLLRKAQAGRALFLTSAVAYKGRAYWGAYAASKAALDALVRSYAAECATTNVRANLFAPGPTCTRMYLGAFPGVDPKTLPTPDDVAKAMVPLCLPVCTENGRIYDFRAARFLDFHAPN